ncbi:type-F conjugative transfer system pilin assembly protein TrbC, partial [Photobacterium iliopiscarium]
DAAPPSIIVFVSLGMPETSLKQLLLQAEQLHVPIVIRGIFGNDFNTTIAKVKKLVQPQQGQSPLGGVSINPIWFKQFGIKQVPAFVVMKPNTCTDKPPCDPKNYDVIYGNVSLFDALDTVAREGTYHAIARKSLP